MKNTEQCKFGDIVLADLPYSDDRTKSKIRPMLVLKKDNEDFLLAKITSKHHAGRSHTIIFSPSSLNGLEETSICRLDKFVTLGQVIMIGKLGSLSSQDQEQIKLILHDMIDSL